MTFACNRKSWEREDHFAINRKLIFCIENANKYC